MFLFVDFNNYFKQSRLKRKRKRSKQCYDLITHNYCNESERKHSTKNLWQLQAYFTCTQRLTAQTAKYFGNRTFLLWVLNVWASIQSYFLQAAPLIILWFDYLIYDCYNTITASLCQRFLPCFSKKGCFWGNLTVFCIDFANKMNIFALKF